MSSRRKITLFSLSVVTAGLLAGVWFNRVTIKDSILALNKPPLPAAVSRNNISSSTSYQLPATTSTLPTSFNLKVPFTSQAPTGDWNMPYQEACEEASILTVDYYWQNKTFTPAIANDEILKIVAFENQLLGRPDAYKDTSASTTAMIAQNYWPQYQTKVTYNFSVQDIETQIAAGRPVIVFFYGKALHNPNYKNGGPLYHALVIKGYTPTSFITNDVGTRNGADYVYPIQTIMNASHDWNNGDVQNGQPAMLVMWPK